MTMPQTPRILLIGTVVVLLAGCSAHYRNALEDYQKAEPLPFEQRTFQWVRENEGASSPTAVQPPGIEGETEMSRPTTEDTFLRIAGGLFGESEDSFAKRVEPLRDQEGLEEKVAASPLTWETTALAISLHNPGVQAAQDRWEATLRQYSQADFLDALVGQYRTFTRYLDVKTGKPLNKEMTQRFFPYPSTIALKGEVVREQVRMAELDWQKTLRDAVIEGADAFFDYQYLNRAESTTRENVALVENLLGVIEERYRAGRATQPDLIKVQTELERQRNMLEDLEAKGRSAVARINALVNRAPDTPLGPPEDMNLADPKPEFDDLLTTALKNRQEVNMQRAKVARVEAAVRMGEVMNRPLATQGYSLFERGMMPEASEGESRMSYGMMAKAPDRLNFAQTEAYLAEMRERLQAEKAMLDQVETKTRSMVRTMLQDLDVAAREVRLVEEIVLPQNQSAYETALGAYTAGRMSFIDLLDSERALLRARLEEHDSRRALNQTIIRLAMVRGAF